jgi:hypothetical protein
LKPLQQPREACLRRLRGRGWRRITGG